MKEKLNKSQLASLLNKLTNVETIANYEGDFVEMNVTGKLNQKKEQEISLKSIYKLIIENQKDNNERFDAIDKLIIENQKDNNARFDAIDNEIKTVKADVNSVKKDVKNLDIKLNKVIELNNLEF